MTIDEILEITKQSINVDGDDVYILKKEMHEGIEKIKKQLSIKEKNCLITKISKDVEFICCHLDFAMVFRPVQWGKSKRWIPCLVYKYKGEWRRVVLQYASCLKCDWNGSIANPTDPDLYITMKNRFDILKKVNNLPFLKCPKCGNNITSKAIWVDNKSDT